MPFGQPIGMNHNIVLSDTFEKTGIRTSFDFTLNDPFVVNVHTTEISIDLDTSPNNQFNFNLACIPYVTQPSQVKTNFEFGEFGNQYFGFTGSSVSVELEVSKPVLTRLINIPCIGYYEPPVNPTFELGADTVEIIKGTGGEVDPTGYNLNFQSDNAIDETAYDLIFLPAQDIIKKSFSWDFYAVFNGSSLDVELTIDRDVIGNDIEVCSKPSGAAVRQELNLSQPVATELNLTTKLLDNRFEFKFDDGLQKCTFDIELAPAGHDTESYVDLTFGENRVDTEQVKTPNFDLYDCTKTTNFDLTECFNDEYVSGKNLNYDILLCPADANPPLNIDNHNFAFKADFLDKNCDELILDFYHGADGTAFIAADIEIDDVDPEHGAYAELDLFTIQNLAAEGYHGAYQEVADLATFPAALIDGDADHGAYADADLLTLQIFSDVDMYNGATFEDFDLQTFLAPTFEPVAEGGATLEFEILTAPVFQTDGAYAGAYSDTDLTDFPSIDLEADAYAGSVCDAVVLVSAILDCEATHGLYSDMELETFESSGFGDIFIDNGASAEVDLAYTPTLDMEGNHGAYIQDLELNVSTTFEAEAYEGAAGDLDLTVPAAPDFDCEATHGVYAEFDLSQIKALFPRALHGAYVDLDLEDHPAIDLLVDGYHGAVAELDTLDETDFNTFGYHGATLEDLNLQVAVNMVPEESPHGAVAEADLAYTPTFECEAYAGADGTVSAFEVPPGENIVAEAYAGENFYPSLEAPIHEQFDLHPIVASQTLYDGLGGVGGLNHCPISSTDLDPIYGDNVTRLGFDPLGITDQLNISFDDIGDDPWTTCNAGGIKYEVDFMTNPRFECEAYAGEYVEMFIPLEVMPLIGVDVPLSRLYDFEYQAIIVQHFIELEDIRYETTGTVWNHPDDVTAFYEMYFSAELDLTAFSNFYHGAYALADLAVPVPAWKTAQHPIETGEHIRLEFEPVEYTRFCKGYIVPNGNSVVFEYSNEEDYDCSIFLGTLGEKFHDMELQTIQSMYPEIMPHGAVMDAIVTVQTFWTAIGRHGHVVYAQFFEEPEFEMDAYDGSFMEVDFYEPPTDGYHGAHMAIDDLVIPGPGIEWVTETQCLPNDYVPLTEDGDPDLSQLEPDENGVVQVPSVPVEYKPYRATVLAQCVTFIESGEE